MSLAVRLAGRAVLLLSLAGAPSARATEIVVAPTGVSPTAEWAVREAGRELLRFVPDTPPAERGPSTVDSATIAGHRVLAVRLASGKTGQVETIVAESLPSGARTIWRGLTGPQDADAETMRELTIGDGRVSLFQTAARVRRCDGRPARLFARIWDFARQAFVKAPPPAEPAAAAATAHLASAPLPSPLIRYTFTAASDDDSAGGDARRLSPPLALDDGDPTSAWTVAGDGVGVFVTAETSAGPQTVAGLHIQLSPADTAKRPTRLRVILGSAPGQTFTVDLPARGGARPAYSIPLPMPVVTACVTVAIETSAGGGEKTAIAELSVFTELDGPDGLARLVDRIRQGGACDALVPHLVRRGPTSLPLLATAIPQARDNGLRCLLTATQRIAEPAVPAEIPAGLGDGLLAVLAHAGPEHESGIAAVLIHLPNPPIAALSAVSADESRDVKVRQRALALLGAIDSDDARAAVLARCGRGPVDLRRAVRNQMTGQPGPIAAAIRAALDDTASEDVARRADLVAILGGRATREPADIPENARRLYAALADPHFEVAARALTALGQMRSPDSHAAIARLMADRTSDQVLRALAAQELAVAPRDLALPALRSALLDGDPRVREIAALAHARHHDVAATPAIIDAAKREPWPFVRRAQVAAIADLCGAGAGDLLARAVARDVDAVRQEALRGLVHCRDPRAREVLLHVLGRDLENTGLRESAAQLIADVADDTLVPTLVAILDHVRMLAQSDLSLQPVAASLAHTLGRLGGADARRALVILLGDPQPALRVAAIDGLGALCDPGEGARALQQATHDPALARAAEAAVRSCTNRRAVGPHRVTP